MTSHLVSEDLSEISSDDQYPRAKKACSAFRWKQNWKCALLTGLVCSCLVTAVVYHRQRSPAANSDPIAEASVRGASTGGRNAYWTLIFCSVVLYSLYLMECSYATDRIELCDRNTQNVRWMCEKIEQMRNSQPVIWWKATCYHYARRKIRTTRFRRGTYFVSTKVYQERVNSFSSSSAFDYVSCGVKDISNNLVIGHNCGPVVKFRFSKGFAFLNMASAIEFEDQRSTFFRELRRYDDFMDIHEGLDLSDCPSFDEEILALNAPPDTKPWFADPFYYWLCSCLLLSWPFRLVLAYNTVHVHYKITKLFGTNYANFTESTQQLALFQLYETRMRDSTGAAVIATPAWSTVVTPDDESSEGRLVVRTAAGSALVPTYSEALLLLDDQDTETVAYVYDEGDRDAAAANRVSFDDRPSAVGIRTAAAASIAAVISVPPTPIHTAAAATATAAAVVPAARRCPADEAVADDAAGDFAAALPPDGPLPPPSYEEALNLPLVNAAAPSSSSSSPAMPRFHVDAGQRRQPASLTSRTFLSIETSL